MGLSRRHFVAAGGAFLSHGARAAPVPLAGAFTDSVGVCVHIASPPYSTGFGQFRDLLGGSGIGHVREEIRPGDDLGRWRALQEKAGVRWHLLASPATNTVRQALGRVTDLGAGHVSAIEGQNEGDMPWFAAEPVVHGDWPGTVVAYQRDLFRAFRGVYPAASLPVVSPTVLDFRPGDMAAIEGASAYCDIVGLHAYAQHAEAPETDRPRAALSWYVRQFRDPFKPGAPVMVTETGYSNVVAPGGRGVSERAAAIYLPRLLLHNFGAGVARTFLYEFMDGGTDPADTEHHYGLVRFDGSRKPAYHAVRALLLALRETAGVAAPPGGDVLDVRDAPGDLRQQLLALRDGRTVMALWRPVASWDAGGGHDVVTARRPVTMVSSRPGILAEIAVPNDGVGWSPLPVSGGRIVVPVDDRVTLVRVTRHGG